MFEEPLTFQTVRHSKLISPFFRLQKLVNTTCHHDVYFSSSIMDESHNIFGLFIIELMAMSIL